MHMPGVSSRAKSDRSDAVAAAPPRGNKPGVAPSGETSGNGSTGVGHAISAQVESRIGRERFGRYIRDSARFRVGRDGVDVAVPNRYTMDVLDRRFGDEIRAAVREAVTGDEVEVRFRVDPVLFKDPAGDDAARQDDDEAHAAPTDRVASRRSAAPVDRGASVPRPPRTPMRGMDDFLVGASNRVAHAASTKLIDDVAAGTPGLLFLHGACGLGKTHLLQGIASSAKRVPGSRVRYITAEAFTNKYIYAVRNRKLDAFRREFRGLDLLCIDDVHFLSGKEGTQSELLHTLDALDLGRGKIALASDEHPSQIAKLSSKLSSRMMCGAVVRLDPPDEELRLRIAARLATRRGIPATMEALRIMIALAPDGTEPSVREIEGRLAQIEAVWRLGGQRGHVDADTARSALAVRTSNGSGARVAARAAGAPATVEEVLRVVCREIGVTEAEALSPSRHRRIVLARTMTVYLARRVTNKSFPEIATALRRRTHSTAVSANQRFIRAIESGGCVEVGSPVDGEGLGTIASRLEAKIRSGVM